MSIDGDVTANQTILDANVEKGCRILICKNKDAERLWNRLQFDLGLTCAHISISEEVRSGCVMDVFRKSLCTGKKDFLK